MYKITLQTEWQNFKGTVIAVIWALIVSPIIYYTRHPEGNFLDFLPYVLLLLAVFLIPVFILHLRYYSLNIGYLMVIENSQIVIKNVKANKESSFKASEVKHVFHYMTAPKAENRIHWMPWDSYNYIRIFLNNGEVIIITSLMAIDLKLPVDEKQYSIIHSFYPFPAISHNGK